MNKRYASQIGTEDECLNFSSNTDDYLSGVWYHATTADEAHEFSNGTKRFESDSGKAKSKISFTRDPNGAARNLAGWEAHRWVIRAYINAKRPPDLYDTDKHDLTNDFNWVHVWDVRYIMIEEGSVHERNDG